MSIQITLVSNEGAGYAKEIPIAEGTSLHTFIQQHLPHAQGAGYEKLVNREVSVAHRTLQEGDIVTVVPTNYKSQ